ncbi:MAG: hypothetical protein KIS67_07845 [Verrucomicrobiae bacterium]|nr:hypothetical protein [Verrucomicrobiae bacterium]
MPKEEFDFEDPFELNGMAFLTHEDTTNDMAETFIEEFMRMGYGHKQVLALFRNPYYLGPHMALEKRGEPFIRELIAEVFARWGKAITWSDSCNSGREEAQTPPAAPESQSLVTSAATVEMDSAATDPMGSPIPKLNL